jgi:signal transduction histidine kinase
MNLVQTDEHQLQQIMRLTEVSRALTYAASLDEVLKLTVDHAAALFSADRSLLLVANEAGLLALRCSHGVDAALAQGFHEPLNEALVPRLAALLDTSPEGFLGVPLVIAGAIKGLLVVIRPTPSNDAKQDEWLLSALADQAAVALERARLGEIAEFREQLMGVVGHDLRGPLSTIRMGAYVLLQREGLGEIETEMVRKITRSATQAERLIDQLLDLTRSRLGGGIPIDPKRFDMSDVCRQVVGETEIMHPDRSMQVDVRGDLMGVWDRDRMYQLLANLLRNAVQHGEPKSAIVVRLEGGETQVVIEVFNHGEPIPPAALPYIFHAFRKGRSEPRFQTQGLGLGLFIAQEIARSHGGLITATSSESEGTAFRVRLPRDSATVAA